MNTKMILAAAIVAVSGTAASAQVLQDLNLMVNTLTTNVGGTVIDISTNLNTINGNIDLDLTGQNGLETDDSTTANDIINATDVGLDLDISATGLGSLDLGVDVGGYLNDDTLTTAATSMASATSMTFGDLATQAVGAINSSTNSLTETASTIMSSSDTNASSTAASAMFDSAAGSGLFSLSGAGNFADINGQIEITAGGGDFEFGDLSTTAAGSINTGQITAAFIGTAPIAAP